MRFLGRTILLAGGLAALTVIAFQVRSSYLRDDEARFQRAVGSCLLSVLAQGETPYLKVATGKPRGLGAEQAIGVVYLEKQPRPHRR